MAIDADTKLIPSFLVGKRDAANTSTFVTDLASRLRGRPQITTDGLALYINAVQHAFGCEVDYGQVIKSYEADPVGAGRYSPPKVMSIEKAVVLGRPDLDTLSTSYVERHNLDMRMQIRRMTRLTNAFSKKLRNHRAATALHFAHYNLARIHGTLRTTPAMAAGITATVWSMDDLLDAALHAVESRAARESAGRVARLSTNQQDVRKVIFAIRLSEVERELLEAAATRAGARSASGWARDALLAATSHAATPSHS